MIITRQSRQVFPAKVLFSAMLIAGCGPDPNGPGSYQAVMQAAQSAEQKLTAQGAKLSRKSYPPGDAWVVDLAGQQIDDETVVTLRNLDHVSELDLSGTNVTDAHLQQLGAAEISGVLVKLNLSKTAVSDAGLMALKESLFLSELNVSGSRITEAGLAEWQKQRDADTRIRPAFKKVKVTR